MPFNWLSTKKKPGEIAKDRLRVVIVQDRLSLAPALMEEMKDEVVLAISKYVEIDPSGVEFDWKDINRKRALVASIPVISTKRGMTVNDRAAKRPY